MLFFSDQKKRYVYLFVIFILLIIFAFLFMISSKKFYVQITNKRKIHQNFLLPDIKYKINLLSPNNFCYIANDCLFFNIFETGGSQQRCDDVSTVYINCKGDYEFTLSASGSKFITNLVQDDDLIIDDENLFTDCYVELLVNDFLRIPLFANHRVDGPENMMTYSQILKVEETPYPLNFTYVNIDNRILENFVLSNFSLNIKKI